ncbi:MAG: hypothetical protein JWL63_714 [Rhodocyclales bacterium]|nr:hypothetical protein [Rhodocyclales bacterium]
MKTRNRVISAVVFGLGLMTLSVGANARGYDNRHGWGHDHYYGHGYRGERVVERRYAVREPRYYEPVVYERPVPVYRSEPGVVVQIGLPPIIIPFH